MFKDISKERKIGIALMFSGDTVSLAILGPDKEHIIGSLVVSCREGRRDVPIPEQF